MGILVASTLTFTLSHWLLPILLCVLVVLSHVLVVVLLVSSIHFLTLILVSLVRLLRRRVLLLAIGFVLLFVLLGFICICKGVVPLLE